jgi:hypothetical protein
VVNLPPFCPRRGLSPLFVLEVSKDGGGDLGRGWYPGYRVPLSVEGLPPRRDFQYMSMNREAECVPPRAEEIGRGGSDAGCHARHRGHD